MRRNAPSRSAPSLHASSLVAAAALAAGSMLPALGLGLAGCSSTPSAKDAAMAAHPRAADIWSVKCGSCHVPVDPGTRTRAALEAALGRHRDRLTLPEEDWRELVELLAPPPAAVAPGAEK